MFIYKKFFRVYFIFLLFFNICIANTNDNSVNVDNDKYKRQMLEQTIEYFYLDPQESTAKKVIKEIESMDQFFYVFVALARKYPYKIVKWIEEVDVDFKKNPNVIKALYFANLKSEAILLAQKAKWPIKKIVKIGSLYPCVFDIQHTLLRYIQWMIAEFFITGNTEYIKKILQIFELSKEEDGPEEANRLIEEAKEEAKINLQCMIFKHDKIYKLCKEEVELNQKKYTHILTKLLSELNRSPEHFTYIKEGGLSGTILISDDPDFEKDWYTLPIMTKVKCKRDIQALPYPKENKTIKVFILFSGFELNDNFCDLTYDIEIFDPKNERIDFYKDLVAIKRKVASRFFVQLAEQVPSFDFIVTNAANEEDKVIKPGIYTIKVTLRDNISKIALNLESSFKIHPQEP